MAESLVEFSREDKGDSSKSKYKNKDEDGMESLSKERLKSPSKRRNLNEEQSKIKKPMKCFLCSGAHQVRECTICQKLSYMLTIKENEQGEVA